MYEYGHVRTHTHIHTHAYVHQGHMNIHVYLSACRNMCTSSPRNFTSPRSDTSTPSIWRKILKLSALVHGAIQTFSHFGDTAENLCLHYDVAHFDFLVRTGTGLYPRDEHAIAVGGFAAKRVPPHLCVFQRSDMDSQRRQQP